MTTTILQASTIITMDPARPRATAVAVDDDSGRIVAVGSPEDCSAAAPGAETKDLGDTVLMPGFVEAHSHPFVSGAGTQPPVHWIAPYVGYPTWADVEKLFAKSAGETPKGHGILFSGLDRLLQGVAAPSKEDLDRYFPEHPVAVLDNSGHAAYFNTAVIEKFGWDEETPKDPVGARFGRSDDGGLDGRAYEMAAVFEVLNPMMAEVVTHPLHSAAQWYRLMATNGITATSDMTYQTATLKGYEALLSVPGCPLRLSLYHMSTQDDAGTKLPDGLPEDMIRKQGIKLWADGSPWVGTAALSFPYLETDEVRAAGIPIGPSSESALNYTRSELDAILDEHAPQGWQMAFHVNGDVGIDLVLDAYEHALVKHGLMGTDHRWRIEHCGAGRRDQYERAAGMGVAVSQGPFQFIYWGDLLDGTLFEEKIGSQWMAFKDAFDAGTRPSFHNDGSVSPPIPLLNIQAAITRATPSGKVHGEDQAITLDQALEAETINAAWQLHRDDEIGSISQGKYADLVELSKDPHDADPMAFTDQVKVLGTWLGGKRLDPDAFVDAVDAMDPTPHKHMAKGHEKCC